VKPVTHPEKNTLETILAVEDHPVVCEVVREILERAGFCVLAAGSGAKAIQVENVTIQSFAGAGTPGTPLA